MAKKQIKKLSNKGGERKENDRTVNYWNNQGSVYNRAWQSVAKKQLSILEKNLVRNAINLARKDDTVLRTLDVGIGTGRISETVLRFSVNHFGIDISQTMVDYCLRKFKNNKKVKKIAVYDIFNSVPKSWGAFDFVSAIRVLSYTSSWQRKLNNIYRSMAPGGIFIFSFPNKYSSMFLSRLVHRKNMKTPYYDISKQALEKATKEAGFSEYKINGLYRLLDVFYDRSNGKAVVKILFFIERVFDFILGKTFFTRIFYVVCKK